MKLTLLVELTVDDNLYGTDPKEIAWMHREILGDPNGLILHSNEIGDEVGTVRVLEIRSVARCEKVAHDNRSGGYLHGENDDGPYDVDGLRYCGRCHHFLGECESRRASAAPVATPTWPDWLSPEYQAIVKMVKDAMRRAEDDICNSEDASGLPRTAEGERNVYAGAIVHAFKRAGWFPPSAPCINYDAASGWAGDPCRICGRTVEQHREQPAPEAQRHDAPTCPGWWWARWPAGDWTAVRVVARDVNRNGADVEVWHVLVIGEEDEFQPHEFNRWVGPLIEPGKGE